MLNISEYIVIIWLIPVTMTLVLPLTLMVIRGISLVGRSLWKGIKMNTGGLEAKPILGSN